MRSRVALVTLGSSGDVHPFLGLGLELRRRGHGVTLLTNPRYADLAERHGLGFVGVGTVEQYESFTNNPDAWHRTRAAPLVLGAMADYARPTHAALAALDPRPDVVVASTLGVGGRVFHETHGVPLVTVHLAPTAFRSVHDPPRLPGLPPLHRLPAFAKPTVLRHFWNGADRYVLDPTLRSLAEFRRELGLDDVTGYMGDWWHSPQRTLAMWPEWFAPAPPDWPESVRFCGFPLYDERETAALSPGLSAWLDEGEAPVAFTPGSAMRFGRRFFEAAAGACDRLGVRGVLLTRYDEQVPATLPDGVRHEAYAPFSALLPRCRAAVHHGGVGTLSQALAAGRPQVVMPMAHDQLDNARRLGELGVGAAIGPRRFTARRLGRTLGRLLDSPAVAARCREVAARVDAAAGLTTAADHVEAVA